MPIVGKKVAGYNFEQPIIPVETRTEQVRQLRDEMKNIVRHNSPLQRPIQFITPDVHKHSNFMVPNLLLHNSGGGNFSSGTALQEFNSMMTRKERESKLHTINLLVDGQISPPDMGLDMSVAHESASVVHASQIESASHTPMSDLKLGPRATYNTTPMSLPRAVESAAPQDPSRFVQGLNSFEINALPPKVQHGRVLPPIKMRLQPLKPRNLSEIPQHANMIYHFMQRRVSDASRKNRLPETTQETLDCTDPKDRIKTYLQREEDERKANEWRTRRFVLKKNCVVNELQQEEWAKRGRQSRLAVPSKGATNDDDSVLRTEIGSDLQSIK